MNKQLEGVQKLTFDDMFGYDAAIRVTDDDNVELAAAVWKCVAVRSAECAGTTSDANRSAGDGRARMRGPMTRYTQRRSGIFWCTSARGRSAAGTK